MNKYHTGIKISKFSPIFIILEIQSGIWNLESVGICLWYKYLLCPLELLLLMPKDSGFPQNFPDNGLVKIRKFAYKN